MHADLALKMMRRDLGSGTGLLVMPVPLLAPHGRSWHLDQLPDAGRELRTSLESADSGSWLLIDVCWLQTRDDPAGVD